MYASEGLFSDTILAAHELKSPLALVRQLALNLEHGNLDEAKQIEIARQIILTSERALRLTSDFTFASRQESLEVEPINPISICEDVIHEMSPLYRAHDVSIRLKRERQAPLVIANRGAMHRVLLNLLDNALKHSDSQQSIEVAINKTKDMVRLGVRDYGPSQDETIWKTIRERLKTGSPQSVSLRPESSGLGLMIAKQLSEAMECKLGVIGHRDGATFHIDSKITRQLSLC